MPDNLQALATRIAQKHGIPVSLFLHLVNQESGWNPRAGSSAGAQGLTQLMPATARGLGVTDPFDPIQSLTGGAKYLKQQYDRFGKWNLALSAYNSGPGGSESSGRVEAFPETQNYVKSIMAGLGSPRAATLAQPGGGAPPPTPMGSPLGGARRQAALDFIFGPEFAGLLPQVGGGSTPMGPGRPVSPPNATAAPKKLRVRGQVPSGAQGLVELAKHFVGNTPYSWGGGSINGPSRGFGRGANTVGFDCSSFVQFLAHKMGVNIPRTTYDQWRTGKAVAKNQLRVGDAVFFEATSRGPGHIGMYIGNGKFVEAPHTGLNVRISTLAGRGDYVGARRFW